MKSSQTLHLTLIFLSSLLFMSQSCGKKKEEAVNTAVAETKQEKLDKLEYFQLKENTKSAVSYNLHKAGQGNASADCRISKKDLDTSPQTILCWLDSEELDLYFNGLNFSIDVPSKVCNYISYHPFNFYQWQPGSSSISYTTYTYPSDGCATCDGSSTCSASDAIPKFKYDHSSEGGPNCDTGKITLIAKVYTSSPSKTCFSNTTLTETIGSGKWNNCWGGPGKDFQLDAAGHPIGLIYFSYDGLQTQWTHDAPIKKTHFSNRYIANYTNNCAETSTDSFSYNFTKLINYSQVTYTESAGNSVPDPWKNGANPFYVWTCYDKAYEVKGRILLQVRDWNTKFSSTDDLDKTNPTKMDAGGTENPYGYNNDLMDWDDTASAVPSCLTNSNSTGFAFPSSSSALY